MGLSGASGRWAADFTDGDTFKRVTVTDPRVQAGSAILPGIQRATTTDNDDPGWAYLPNVVTVRPGSFDVVIAAFSNTSDPSPGEVPNETVSIVYVID